MKRHLRFPHSLFAIHYHKKRNSFVLEKLQVAFSNTKFTGKESDKLYGLPLGNTDEGFNICLPESESAATLKELIQNTIALFWSSPFKDYFDGHSYWYRRYHRSGFAKKWYKSTDETFIKSAELLQPPFMVSVKHLLRANGVKSKRVVKPKKKSVHKIRIES